MQKSSWYGIKPNLDSFVPTMNYWGDVYEKGNNLWLI
jgi:predicted FMN-binding regulatory protein PaiB